MQLGYLLNKKANKVSYTLLALYKLVLKVVSIKPWSLFLSCCSFLFQFFLAPLLLIICTDDHFHQPVAHYVGLIKGDVGDAFNILEDAGGFKKA